MRDRPGGHQGAAGDGGAGGSRAGAASDGDGGGSSPCDGAREERSAGRAGAGGRAADELTGSEQGERRHAPQPVTARRSCAHARGQGERVPAAPRPVTARRAGALPHVPRSGDRRRAVEAVRSGSQGAGRARHAEVSRGEAVGGVSPPTDRVDLRARCVLGRLAPLCGKGREGQHA